MTIKEKTARLTQGDISNWLNTISGTFNHSGLVQNFEQKAGQFYIGYQSAGDGWPKTSNEGKTMPYTRPG
jgi:beta-glucosidase